MEALLFQLSLTREGAPVFSKLCVRPHRDNLTNQVEVKFLWQISYPQKTFTGFLICLVILNF